MIPRAIPPALPAAAPALEVAAEQPAGAGAARSSAREARGLSLLDRLTLAAIVLLVVVVSIPRLREMALDANEEDARVSLRWLGGWLLEADLGTVDLLDRLQGRADLDRRMPDARVLDGTLTHHGYMFRTATARGRSVILAWPLERGRTGRACYRLDADGLARHAAGDGAESHDRSCRWSGPARPAQVEGARWIGLDQGRSTR